MIWTCEGCSQQFEAETNSEEERVAELKQNFGEQWEPEDCVKVCTECYNEFMERNAAKK